MEIENGKTRYERAREKLAPVLRAVCRWCKRLVWVFPPVVVLVAMLVTFDKNGLYPFGGKTVAWCDMEQQVIPLLLQFKDVLAGKGSFLFSLKNAGGMNFYGVFFFFLASPFTFLVAFVGKGEIASFCNVLILLKMCACALTSSLYLQKKQKDAPLLNVVLSVLYAYSGYTMLYYQNMMWLDVAYLFPLLLMGLEGLQKGKKALFTVILSASMVVNYYLGYMLVLFLLLYALVWVCLTKDKTFAFNFLRTCFWAALLTAIVWLPSFWQYLSSGRTTSIFESLIHSSVLTPYQTAVPTIFSVLFLFPFALGRKENADGKLRKILFLATLIPIVLEPINRMWHTGSYMCFPTRYGFMPIFLCISLAFDGLANSPKERITEGEEKGKRKRKQAPMYALSGVLLVISVLYCAFACGYTQDNVGVMDQYSHSLWGNDSSFQTLLSLYLIALLVGVAAFLFWRFRLLKPVLLWVSVGIIIASELYVAPMTYMLTPAREVTSYQRVTELADKIEDEDFYRVKTDREYSGEGFHANLMGGLGYNALGHYTSLTKQNYMQAIKRFGYTSYWMEVGNSGGTMLTDALLSMKYEISRQDTSGDIYQGSYFNIAPTSSYLSLGAVAKRDIISLEGERETLTRGEMQKTLYQDFLGEDGIAVYELSDAKAYRLTVEKEGEKYRLTPTAANACLTFTLTTEALSSLYFSAFDENTNALSQAINEKFDVHTNKYFLGSYPTQKRNGILSIGDYNGAVTVKIGVKEATTVREMSLIVMEKKKTQSAIGQTPSLGLNVKKGKIGGRYEANGGECVFLSLPYDEGLQLRINGKSAKLYEVYGGFTAFYLREGVNKIQISFRPKGFVLGIALSLVGVAFVAVGIWLEKRRFEKIPFALLEKISFWTVLCVGVAVVLIVYIAPILLCAL